MSAAGCDVEHEHGKGDGFVPPITVSTQLKTADDNGDVASGGEKVNDGKDLERWEEAGNMDQHQPRVGSPLISQNPAEAPPRGTCRIREPQGVPLPNGTTNLSESDILHGVDIRQSPAAGRPAYVPERSRILNL